MRALAWLLAWTLLSAGVARAQPPAPDPPGGRLTLAEAQAQARAHNRQLRIAAGQVAKARDDLESARSRRLPVFSVTAQAGYLLKPVDFFFPRGLFGVYPVLGPIPSTDTRLRTPNRGTVFVSSRIAQPLTQQLRIGLGIAASALSQQIAQARAHAAALAVSDGVTRVYYGMVQAKSATAASDQALTLYRELQRVVREQVAAQAALDADLLEIDARLAQEELSALKLQNAQQNAREQLNQLLGRDLATAVDVEDVPSVDPVEIDLPTALAHALDARPDLREARLTERLAEIDRRATRSGYLPDVSLALTNYAIANVEFVPKSIFVLGLAVDWEPFDWGRRRREVASKAIAVSQAGDAAREAEDRVRLEVGSRFRALGEARAQLRVADLARRAADERLRVRTNQFKEQAVLPAEVLRAQSAASEAGERYRQALAAFWTARADFARAIAEEPAP